MVGYADGLGLGNPSVNEKETEMCYGCYEDYGLPTIKNEQTLAAAECVREIYSYNPVGSNCHIVTDDWNLEDRHIEFCLHQARTDSFWKITPAQRAHEIRTMLLFLSMREEERASALAIWEGWL